MMSDCTTCHSSPGVTLPIVDCRSCHQKPSGLHTKGGHPDAGCTDCHQPHTWKATGREGCLTCHEDKKEHYPDADGCSTCHEFGAKG
jgi:hypothetical protein